jgi:PAS domain S-box-containing protein
MKKRLLQNFISPNKKNKQKEPEVNVIDQNSVNEYFLHLYEQILENNQDVSYCIDYNTFNIEFISPSIQLLTGKSREEFIGLSTEQLLGLIHPKDKDLLLNHFRSLSELQNSHQQSITYRFKPPKGIYRWINDKHSLIYDPRDRSKKIVGSLHDITDQKLMEDALKRSRDRLYMAIEATNDGMWDWRLDTNEVYFDQRFYTMLGYEPNEFAGSFQEWMKRIHPEDIKSVQNHLEKYLQGKTQQWVIEYRYKTKNNGWVWILNRGKVFDRDENDKPLRLVGTHSDITQRKKTELILKQKHDELLLADEKLRDANYELLRLYNEFKARNAELEITYEKLQLSEERFRQLAENTEDIFWLRDQEKIIYVNPTFDKIWGRDRNLVMEDPSVLTNWIYPDDKQSFNTWVTFSELNSQSSFPEQYRIIKPNGEIRWLWSRMFPIVNKDGIIYRIAGIATDITELKIIEEELIAAKEKALESDRLKSAFLANISHEIRTPMNGIIGFASLLKERVLSAEKRDQFIDIITQSSKALLHIIEDIVDVSKLEANQLQISKHSFNLNELIDRIYDQFTIEKQLYGKDHIQLIRNTVPYNTPLIIHTDEIRLNQVISILISNAFKFTDKGTIEFGYNIIKHKSIEFFVSDTGIGISDDVKPYIFERFRQHETTPSRKFGGTGLGLTICEGVIKLLGGHIWFESSKEKGTTFYFTLPYSVIKKSNNHLFQEAEFSDIFDWSDKILLVVEDDPLSQEYFKTIFDSTGIKFLLAMTGEEAINICTTEKHIDIILLDIRLPHMNGYDTFHKIKEIYPDIPIIAQTAFAMTEDTIRFIEMGFSDYLTKPIDRKNMLTKIDYFLSKKVI